jgi:hypothetical protein
MGMGTQWYYASAHVVVWRTGLRYESLPVVASSLEVELSPRVFADIRLMEAEALSAWSKKT